MKPISRKFQKHLEDSGQTQRYPEFLQGEESRRHLFVLQEGLGEADGEKVPDRLSLRVGDTVVDGVALSDEVGEMEGEGLVDWDRVGDGDTLGLRLRVTEDCVVEAVGVAVGVRPGVPDHVLLWLGDQLRVSCGVGAYHCLLTRGGRVTGQGQG